MPRIPAAARPFVVVALFVAAAWYFFAPLEYLAVRSACRREGGLHIERTDDVAGYWHGGYSIRPDFDRADCLLCAEQVASRDFTYVEFERTTMMRKQPSGFVRFELADAGDPGCDASLAVNAMPPGKCIAVRALPGRPTSRYRYRSEVVAKHGILGAEIRERSEVVTDLGTNHPIATLRYFDAASPAERRGRFAPSYACDSLPISPSNEGAFLRSVLKSAARAGS